MQGKNIKTSLNATRKLAVIKKLHLFQAQLEIQLLKKIKKIEIKFFKLYLPLVGIPLLGVRGLI